MTRAGFYAIRRTVSGRVRGGDARPHPRIALDNRRYGYRRVGAELRRQGFVVNHKKVLRLLREDLLAVKKRPC